MRQTRGRKKGNMIVPAFLFFLMLMAAWFVFMPEKISEESSLEKTLGQKKIESGPVWKIPATESKKDMQTQERQETQETPLVTGEIIKPQTIDYEDLETQTGLKDQMETRKNSLGIQKSLDMIVKSDESFIVGGVKVSMQEILKKAFTRKGQILSGEISELGGPVPGKIKSYGIYVIQPGDNIWNIHFNILKELYAFKDIQLSATADEPLTQGLSSGVGKILKFSETTVIIYSLIDQEITEDINLIKPLSKIVVYDMKEVFTLLEEIDYTNIDRVQFDGKNIWIPAKKS